MTYRRWYSGDVEVDGGAYINLNRYVDDYKHDIIRLFSDEDLKAEIQLREEGKSKQERYIEKLLIYDDSLQVEVDGYEVMGEMDNGDILDEVKSRGLNTTEFIEASKYDLRKFICQTLDINELYTDEEIFKMLKEIWKTQM